MATKTLKIGLSARLLHPLPGAVGLHSKTLQMLEQSVAHWVMSRDVLVLMIPTIMQDGLLNRNDIRLRDYTDAVDGLVLQGGADLSPQSYGEEALQPEWAGDRVRDAFEMELLHEFMEAGKPVLGICRGMQLINVALGGTLYQDIATQLPAALAHQTDAYDRHVHAVRFCEGGSFTKIFGNSGGGVVSVHHQAVRVLGRDLVVEAVSEGDDIIEALRWTGRGFVAGTQWHPEFHPPGAAELLDCTPLLQAFLDSARGIRR